MFSAKLHEEYICAAGEYELSRYNGSPKDRQEYLRGYMEAMSRAKEMWDEQFDPPMSDEDFARTQASGLFNIQGARP